MPAQNDFISGLDISSLASVTQAQLLQMINQAGPISNIGFVLCFDGIATGAAGTGFPDVTSNPRFVRYIWLDTNPNGDGANINRSSPVFKRYTGAYTGGPSNPSALSNLYTDWTALGVAGGAITTAMMRLVDATGGVNIALLKLNSDNSATIGKAYYILSVDSAGVNIVASSLTDVLTNGGGVPLANISITGLVASKYLGYSSGLAYRYLNPTLDFTLALGNQIPVSTALAPGTAGYLIRTNRTSGLVEWANTSAADLFNPGDIPISSLSIAGPPVTNDIIKYNGAAWVKTTPTLDLNNATYTQIAGAALLALTGTVSFAHGFTSAPRLVRAVLVTTGELSYVNLDEVDVSCFVGRFTGGFPGWVPAFSVVSNVTNIVIAWRSDSTNIAIIQRDATVLTGIDLTKWTLKVYYWK